MLNLIGEGLAKGTKKALQETAEEVGEKAAAKVAKKAAKKVIPVSYIDDAAEIVVGKPKMMDIYRGISSETTDDMKKYLSDMVDAKIRPRTYGSEAKYGEGYYFGNFGDARGYADRNADDSVRAILKTDVPTNRFITISGKNRNRPEDFYNRALKRAMGADEETVKKQALADIDRYLQKNGLLGFRTPKEKYFDPYYVIAKNDPAWMDNLTVESAIKDGLYDRNTKPDDVLKNELNSVISHPSELSSLLSPEIRNSKGPSLVEMARNIKAMRASRNMAEDGIRRIGSSAVAKVDPSTLPAGYGKLVNYLNGDQTAMLEKTIGKELDDTAAPEAVKQYLKEVGYDIKPNYVDNINTARQVLFDELLDDMNMSGSPYTRFLETRNKLQKDNFGKGVGPRSFTISADDDMLYQTAAAKLDREYSDRLGIGRSHTPMNDNALGPDTRGVYMAGGIGIDPYYATGETGVSTAAHERMHAWQDANSGWDSRVTDAIGELRDELKNFYHDKPTIKKYRGNNYDIDYYLDPKEQEARMLQSYLDNEGFTDTHHKHDARGVEWGNEIKPAFDKFYDKIRALSKAGVALPVGLALLLGENYNNKKKEG